MMDGIAKFGAGTTESFVNPIALITLLLSIAVILFFSHKTVLIIIVSFFFLVPQGQNFYVIGIHVFFHRMIVLVGVIKLIILNKYTKDKALFTNWGSIDTYLCFYVCFQAIIFSLQYQQIGAVINQIAFVLDYLGAYLIIKSMMLDEEDIILLLKALSCIFFLISVSMLVEQSHGVNLFGFIGGDFVPAVRESRVRSMGPFRHPLTAGTAGATAVPLFLFLRYLTKKSGIATLGVISGTIMTICANSSGPLLAYGAGIIAILAWRFRRWTRWIRWTAAFSILILHIMMKAPVWFLMARIDMTGSSSSYHRAVLVDQFISNFSDWWLLGSPNHANWGYFLWDVQNQYVSAGVEGGLVTLVCFLAIIFHGFSMIGNSINRSNDQQYHRYMWALGAALFSFVIAFMGVNLFDQSRVLWLILLATISFFSAQQINSNLDAEP